MAACCSSSRSLLSFFLFIQFFWYTSHPGPWITNQPQYMRTLDYVSDTIICSTGAPQGTVLAPFLFTLYTTDFYHQSPHCHLQKFSDDSAVISLMRDRDDRAYRELTQDFVDWCQRNQRPKDQRAGGGFPQAQTTLHTGEHPGNEHGVVTSYNYLGVHLNNKLDWTDHTAATYKKGQSRLYLLRYFGVQSALLTSFYDSAVASAIFYRVVCWSSSIT